MTRADAIASLTRTTHALCDLLRRSESFDAPIPHLTWTVGECAAHILISNRQYMDQIRGPGIHLRIEDTSAVNDWSVMGIAGLDPDAVIADIASTTQQLAQVRDLPPGATFTWWSGSQASVDTALGLLVGERLVHGWDIAKARNEPWPIDRHDAAVAMCASFAVMPLLVDPEKAEGFDAVLEMRLRGEARYELRFADGTLETSRTERAERADCRVSADPVAMLLVGYGRIRPYGPALRGRIIAWGRKPWLPLTLQRVVRSP